MKKLFALLAVVIFSIGMMTSCTQKGETPSPSTEKPTERETETTPTEAVTTEDQESIDASDTADSTPEFTDPQRFLDDMSAGLDARSDVVEENENKVDGMSDVQYVNYCKKLWQSELRYLDKYQNAVFENQDFDTAAHNYIGFLHDGLSVEEDWLAGNLSNVEYVNDSDRITLRRTEQLVYIYETYGLTTKVDISVYKDAIAQMTGESVDQTEAASQEDTYTILDKFIIEDFAQPREIIVIQNTSSTTMNYISTSSAYDAEGNIISASEGYALTIAPGDKAVISIMYNTSDPIDHTEDYIITERSYYDSKLEDIEFETTTTANGVIVSATNTGEERVGFVHVFVIFIKDGTPVYISEGTIGAGNGMPVGVKLSVQCDNYGRDYDSFELYSDCSEYID